MKLKINVPVMILFFITLSLCPSYSKGEGNYSITAPSIRQNIRFTHLTTDDGLSQNSVRAILQDHLGFIWLGTWSGLNRYDGMTFTVYQHNEDDPKSLSHNLVTALIEDTDNRLWVGTLGGGINILDPITQRFIHHRHVPNDPTTLSHDKIAAILRIERGHCGLVPGEAV